MSYTSLPTFCYICPCSHLVLHLIKIFSFFSCSSGNTITFAETSPTTPSAECPWHSYSVCHTLPWQCLFVWFQTSIPICLLDRDTQLSQNSHHTKPLWSGLRPCVPYLFLHPAPVRQESQLCRWVSLNPGEAEKLGFPRRNKKWYSCWASGQECYPGEQWKSVTRLFYCPVQQSWLIFHHVHAVTLPLVWDSVAHIPLCMPFP